MTKGLRDFGNAAIVALVSIGLILGALSISLVEFVPTAPTAMTDSLFPAPAIVTATDMPEPGISTFPAGVTSTGISSSCQPPSGWGQIVIQGSDTLDIIAARYRTSKELLRAANCLLSDSLVAGTVLYVPPTPTSTSAGCNQGAAGWVKAYVVKPGDTFYSIATNHYTTANQIKSVNCRISDIIYSGEVLWAPNVATRTPVPAPPPGTTVTPHPTDPLTETALPFTATVLPSNTTVPSTPTTAPTATPIPTTTASPTVIP